MRSKLIQVNISCGYVCETQKRSLYLMKSSSNNKELTFYGAKGARPSSIKWIHTCEKQYIGINFRIDVLPRGYITLYTGAYNSNFMQQTIRLHRSNTRNCNMIRLPIIKIVVY